MEKIKYAGVEITVNVTVDGAEFSHQDFKNPSLKRVYKCFKVVINPIPKTAEIVFNTHLEDDQGEEVLGTSARLPKIIIGKDEYLAIANSSGLFYETLYKNFINAQLASLPEFDGNTLREGIRCYDAEDLSFYQIPEFSVVAQDEQNQSASDGKITVNIIQPEELEINDFEYSKDGGETFQDSPIFNDLSPSLYLIKVRKKADNSCSVTKKTPIKSAII